MGKRGPKKTNAETLRRRRADHASRRIKEPEPIDRSRPEPPAWIPREGKAEWKRIAAELEAMGILGRVDRSLMADYVLAWDSLVSVSREWLDAGKPFTSENPTNGTQCIHPLYRAVDMASNRLRRAAANFGLAPGNRANLAQDVSVHEQKRKARADATRAALKLAT